MGYEFDTLCQCDGLDMSCLPLDMQPDADEAKLGPLNLVGLKFKILGRQSNRQPARKI